MPCGRAELWCISLSGNESCNLFVLFVVHMDGTTKCTKSTKVGSGPEDSAAGLSSAFIGVHRRFGTPWAVRGAHGV